MCPPSRLDVLQVCSLFFFWSSGSTSSGSTSGMARALALFVTLAPCTTFRIVDEPAEALSARAWSDRYCTAEHRRASPIIDENCQQGSPPEEWDVNAAGDPSIQGFATGTPENLRTAIHAVCGRPLQNSASTSETRCTSRSRHRPLIIASTCTTPHPIPSVALRSHFALTRYRVGYYGGNGARKVATFRPEASLPQEQPECSVDDSTLLVDCGSWHGPTLHRSLVGSNRGLHLLPATAPFDRRSLLSTLFGF